MTDARTRLSRFGSKLITFHPAPGANVNALIDVIPVIAALVLVSAIHGPRHGLIGMLGAMGGLSGKQSPPRTRLRILLGVGVVLMISQTIGISLSSFPVLLPAALGIWSFVMIFVWNALHLGPPGPLNVLFAAALASYYAAEGMTYADIMPATAASFLLAAATSMIVILVNPVRPARRAVSKAMEAVDLYANPEQDATPADLARLRSEAHNSVHAAWWILNDGVWPQDPRALGRPWMYRLWKRMSMAWEGLRADLLSAHITLTTTLHAQSFPSAEASDMRANVRYTPMGRPPWRYLLRTSLERGSRPLMVALRAATGVLVAAVAMEIVPFGRPYWAVLSVLIIVQMDFTRADMTVRAVLRVIGTSIGLLGYLAIMLVQPTPWMRIGIVAVALWTMNALIPRQYGIASIFITIFALMMLPISGEQQALTVAVARIEETVVGLVTAIGVIHVVGKRAPVLLVRSQYRRTLRSLMPVLRDLESGMSTTVTGMEHRNEMVHELIQASAVLSATRPDSPEILKNWSLVDRAVTEFGYDVLAHCWHLGDRPVRWARRISSEITLLLASLPPVNDQRVDPARVKSMVEEIHHQLPPMKTC